MVLYWRDWRLDHSPKVYRKVAGILTIKGVAVVPSSPILRLSPPKAEEVNKKNRPDDVRLAHQFDVRAVLPLSSRKMASTSRASTPLLLTPVDFGMRPSFLPTPAVLVSVNGMGGTSRRTRTTLSSLLTSVTSPFVNPATYAFVAFPEMTTALEFTRSALQPLDGQLMANSSSWRSPVAMTMSSTPSNLPLKTAPASKSPSTPRATVPSVSSSGLAHPPTSNHHENQGQVHNRSCPCWWPWLKYCRHLSIGAIRLENNEANNVKNQITGKYGGIPSAQTAAITYRDCGIKWVVTGDHNYSEHFSRERATFPGGLAIIIYPHLCSYS
ncbi:hypothetical protein H1R20_g11254, partial [Candolleomyces eurysporus]